MANFPRQPFSRAEVIGMVRIKQGKEHIHVEE